MRPQGRVDDALLAAGVHGAVPGVRAVPPEIHAASPVMHVATPGCAPLRRSSSHEALWTLGREDGIQQLNQSVR